MTALYDACAAHPPFCSDCKHNQAVEPSRTYRAVLYLRDVEIPYPPLAPLCRRVRGVDGASTIPFVARMEDSPCGPDGKLFERYVKPTPIEAQREQVKLERNKRPFTRWFT
jgi:hypothetical protein